MRDQVSHPYKITGQITDVYILIFKFLDSSRENERSKPHGSKHSPNLVCTAE
jgi:hypothetical protein